ncbi:hypothetical protein PENSPDRAFT_130474 [Peniophora sp. CONT]|nr:hypothetical protein PENSPDRAFT_130474 [Peniophora sp. CONT]
MAEVAIAPVLRLHDELYYLVFDYLCAIYPAGGENGLGWVSATHVCSRWRRISIDECATLWGESLCAFPKAFTTFLERARDAKLTIKLAEPDPLTEKSTWLESDELRDLLADLFRQRSQQVQHASFAFPAFRRKRPPFNPHAVFNNIAQVGNDPAASNTDPELAADNARITSRGEQASLLSSAVLSRTMGQTLPRLRRLEIIYDVFQSSVQSTTLSNYTAFSAPSLVSLRLFRQRIRVDTLYNILRNTPLLEIFEVQWTASDGIMMISDIPGLRLAEPLELPHLKSFSLGSSTLSLDNHCYFWNLIRAHADVRLSFYGAVFSRQEAIDLVHMLAPQFQRPGLDMLTIRWGGAGRGAGLVLSSSTSTRSDPKPCIDIEFAVHVQPTYIPAVIEQTFTPADYARIRVLNFDVGFGLMTMGLETVHFTALEELRVDLNPDGPLAELDTFTQPDAAQPPSFPALKRLVLKRINLSAFSAWQGEWRAMANTFLRRREELGVPLSKVVLRGMTLGSSVSLDGVEDDVAVRELGVHVEEVIDQRHDYTEGVLEIMADEDFL